MGYELGIIGQAIADSSDGRGPGIEVGTTARIAYRIIGNLSREAIQCLTTAGLLSEENCSKILSGKGKGLPVEINITQELASYMKQCQHD